MCEQFSAKVCTAQDIADRTGAPQAVVSNQIGGFNIIPSGKAEAGTPIIVLGRRLDPEQLSDEQCAEIYRSSIDLGRNAAIRAAYALGHHTAKRAQQVKIDTLLKDRAALTDRINELKLMLADAADALNEVSCE